MLISFYNVSNSKGDHILISRKVRDNDWREIDWLASNAVQEGDHAGVDSEWTRNRLEFEGVKYESVLQSGERVVGYCALVRDHTQDGFRAFVEKGVMEKGVIMGKVRGKGSDRFFFIFLKIMDLTLLST